MKKKLTPEEGLSILNEGISKAFMILDGYPTSALFTCEEYMKLYDCVYDMCVQHPPYEYCAKLYDIFKKALEDGITSRVIPAVKDKSHIFLLYELWNMWSKYKIMAKCLGGFFLYLDRYFVEDRKAASLSNLSISCFHDLVCIELYPKLLEAAICLINEDRDGKSVCRDLLKHVSTFFVEIGRGDMCYYENFEGAVLSSTENYYNFLVPQWLQHYSSADYVLKAEYRLSQEKERASQFLHQTSVEKLLRLVHGLLLGQTANQLHEKQKAESGDASVSYQDVLSRCAGLNLGEGSSPA
ncbi:cullin-1 isoform X1 [Lactuca sativa]|uniref:cullin-1 isoform X1 n=1 Tax=Lactuca sativa TaxID=4236 RepID=UPI000CD95B1A|nr:cullin-1 isoform X1 [Lactuca sativa]XP_023731185.1 cullin-1 isoform X1 [Lactuca sativa]XP_023731187.1 cullin-1 isoform X1 [Lactuca sativa]